MRHTEDLEKGRRAAMEKLVRRIVQEEIVKAFGALGRAADYEGRMTESEIGERAAVTIGAVAENVALRLTCSHSYPSYSPDTCWTCDEPRPEPEDPFKEEKTDGTS